MPAVTVGLVALPLAMAFAIASGLRRKPESNCAVVAGFLISRAGRLEDADRRSDGRVRRGGRRHRRQSRRRRLFMCTLMAGMLLVVLGATGMGSAVKFIPRPVVIGFTNGIAVLIASTQIKDFFGLKMDKVPGEFWLG